MCYLYWASNFVGGRSVMEIILYHSFFHCCCSHNITQLLPHTITLYIVNESELCID